MQLKRRTLLSGLAASAAVPFMSAAHAKQAGAGTKWDKETDVLVIGYGGAGACAAIEAHDKGSKVLIIEKWPSRRQYRYFLWRFHGSSGRSYSLKVSDSHLRSGEL